MKNAKKLLINTLLLTATSLAMKTVAVLYNVFLTGRIGTAGIGLFSLIMTVYAFAKTLGASGLSLASTRLTVDNPDAAARNMRKLVLSGLTAGLIAGALLYFCAGMAAELWLQSAATAPSLRILAFSLPFISMTVCFGGYFTAVRKMAIFAVITFVEQLIKIALSVVFLNYASGSGESCAAISFAILVSEIFSFTVSFIVYILLSPLRKGGGRSRFMRSFLRIAAPDASGAWVRSALRTVEHLLIPSGLKRSGVSETEALASYGAVQGLALPVLLYPASLLSSLSGLLVPEIAESNAEKKKKHIEYMVNRVLSASIVFSIFISGAMLCFSDTLSMAVYKNMDAAPYIKLIAPLIPVMYIDMTIDGMLKGLDKQMAVMRINILDSVICVILVAVLVPKYAVNGYLQTIYIAEIVNFTLSYWTLYRNCLLKISIKDKIIKPMIGICTAVAAGRIISRMADGYILSTVIGITSAALIYIFLLFLMKCITSEETEWIRVLFHIGKKKNPKKLKKHADRKELKTLKHGNEPD
ncbi:MAG: oligosaccharide flippase family protein [Oscillospiraceae bacterium]|nr:oligosaccharide flippase family protein [Oscillospiraceae bacterium]